MRARYLLIIGSLTLASCAVEQDVDAKDAFTDWSEQATNQKDILALNSYLKSQGVGQVFPMKQLLRSDVSWKKCKSEPFSVPPKNQWPNMVPTLQFIRDHVTPLVGRVEAQSVYRAAKINTCIGGASKSSHMRFFAIDMKPANDVSRELLIGKLCRLHKDKGRALNIGLGIYKATRFHIDAAGYRSWGHDQRASSSPCLSN